MAATYIYKPGTYKGPVVLVPSEGPKTAPTITTSDGKTFTGKYLNTNEGRHQYVFPRELYQYKDLNLNYNGQDAQLGSGAISYEGSGLDNLQARAKGSLQGGYGVQGGFEPGMVGQYGSVPSYIGGMFPSPVLAKYKNIKTAPYAFTDPFKFAEKYNQFSREEYKKNFSQSQDLALQTLDTELQGLQEFVPAMSALKRQETSIDNIFNQQQRTQQIDSTLPGYRDEVNADLQGQRGRANAYAEGRIPDATQDRAFELGIRSAAADRAAAGGFGASSSVARKQSDLLSAEQRIKLSQYGDQLLGQNVNARGQFAQFQLAPTEYSNAGSQISVNPSTSIAGLIGSNNAQLNAQGFVPASQAFGSEIQQNQFATGLEQQTRQFNAQNKFQESMFNAGQQNQFAMSLFGYNAGYANSVAGAQQTDINTQFGLQQQQLYASLMQNYMSQAQTMGMFGSLFSGAASLFGGGALGGLTNKSGKTGVGAATNGTGAYKGGGTSLGDLGGTFGGTGGYGTYGGPEMPGSGDGGSDFLGGIGSGIGSVTDK